MKNKIKFAFFVFICIVQTTHALRQRPYSERMNLPQLHTDSVVPWWSFEKKLGIKTPRGYVRLTDSDMVKIIFGLAFLPVSNAESFPDLIKNHPIETAVYTFSIFGSIIICGLVYYYIRLGQRNNVEDAENLHSINLNNHVDSEEWGPVGNRVLRAIQIDYAEALANETFNTSH